MLPTPGGDKEKIVLSNEAQSSANSSAPAISRESPTLTGTSFQQDSSFVKTKTGSPSNSPIFSPSQSPQMNYFSTPVTVQPTGYTYPGTSSLAPMLTGQGFGVQQINYPYMNASSHGQQGLNDYTQPILMGGMIGNESKLGRKRLLAADAFPVSLWHENEVTLLVSIVNTAMQGAQGLLGPAAFGYQFWEGVSRNFQNKSPMECKRQWDQIALSTTGSFSGLSNQTMVYAGVGPQSKKLKPRLQKKKPWTEEEKETIESMQKSIGNRWTVIARKLNYRSSNDVKNYWYSRKRSLAKREQLLEGSSGQDSPKSGDPAADSIEESQSKDTKTNDEKTKALNEKTEI